MKLSSPYKSVVLQTPLNIWPYLKSFCIIVIWLAICCFVLLQCILFISEYIPTEHNMYYIKYPTVSVGGAAGGGYSQVIPMEEVFAWLFLVDLLVHISLWNCVVFVCVFFF